MSEQNMVRLDLMIGGRSFPVKVEKSEVPELKDIESLINKKINEFMVKYPNYERVDLITMAFMSVIFEINKERLNQSLTIVEKRLDDLTEMLDSTL
jgi:cell division protein ZapA (FtsZ GTPase activity inhibitor)